MNTEIKKYWCPSHPEIQSDDPKAICTKCGTMILIPNPNYHDLEGGAPIPMILPKRKLKDFLPLIVIFSVIILFTVITSVYHSPFDITFSMRMMMGSFFAIFGLFKVFNLKAFADAYMTYDILAKRSRAYAFVYPFLELLIAILYLTDIGGAYRDIFTFLLMTVSTIGVIQKLRLKEEIPCACLGMVFKLPMTSVTLIEDIIMGLEAFFMILMPIGFKIAYLDTANILEKTLKLHTATEWSVESTRGHWTLGFFIFVILISSLAERYNWKKKKIIAKYIVPFILILFGVALSFIGPLFHAFITNPQPSAVWYLLTHNSQFLQHFFGGLVFTIAGIAEYMRYGKKQGFLQYIAPIAIGLSGIIFFFHQQLGMVQSVRYAMNWHMTFGVFMVIGSVFRILDITLSEERKSFFTIWVIGLLIGAFMMMTYIEPSGAYQLLF